MKKSFLAFAILQFIAVSLHVSAADLSQVNTEESTLQEPSSAISACMMKNKTVPDYVQGSLPDTYCCAAADKQACLKDHLKYVKNKLEHYQDMLELVIDNCPYQIQPVQLRPCESRPVTIEALACFIDRFATVVEIINECPEAIPAS